MTECNDEVYNYGKSCGLFDMTKEQAEAFCKQKTEETGDLYDWHFVMGRVHIKMIKRTNLKIYFAARFSKRHVCHQLGKDIQRLCGHTVVSRWTLPDSDHVKPVGVSEQAADEERKRFALEDIEDIHNCDWCISIMEPPRSDGRGGRHVEFGIALALGKKLTIIGPQETVFHHLDQVEHFPTIDDFFYNLQINKVR